MNPQRVTVYVLQPNDRATLQLQWVDPHTGCRKTKSAETTDPAIAEDKRTDLESDLNNGRYQETSKLDWDRFRDLFEAEYLPGLRPRSQEKYRTVLDVFEELVNPSKLRTVTERTVSLFIKGMRERDPRTCRRKKQRHSTRPGAEKRRRKADPAARIGLSPVTIRNYLITVKTALQWAAEQKLIASVPAFPSVKVPKKKPQAVPTESFEKLLDKAPDQLWKTYLLCGWYGGLRLSEAMHLQWERTDALPWLDFEGNRIVLPAVFAKSAEDQWVPLHPVLRQALAALPRTSARCFPFRSRKGGGWLTRNGITNRVLSLAKQAGVKLSMHRLRKGFGCRVAQQLGKGNAPILHSLMRHSSMQITMDYYASVDGVLQGAIARLA